MDKAEYRAHRREYMRAYRAREGAGQDHEREHHRRKSKALYILRRRHEAEYQRIYDQETK